MSPERSCPDSGVGDVDSHWHVSPDFYSHAHHILYLISIAIVVALSYYAASKIGFVFTPPHQAISTFWPPNAVLLAALLLVPRREWWIVILAVLPAHFFVQL